MQRNYNRSEITKTEANLIKRELRTAIQKQFKKHDKQCFFSLLDLTQIYTDCLEKWLEPVEGNIAKESYMEQDLLTNLNS